MPGLVTLKTNLKSLKYGHDTPGGGDSNQPYIKTDINKVNDTINKAVDDGLVRGGIVGATKAAVTDTLRIGKFLTDFPKGPLFIIKQVGLQLSNPRLEVPKNPINILSGGISNTLSVGTNGFLQPTRIYNLGINTIAQIPVNAFGVHFDRHGILPVQNEASKYEAVVTANNNLSQASQIAGNAFASLTGAPVALQATTDFVSSANRLFNLTKELGIYGKRGKTPIGYFNNAAVSTGGGQARATFANNPNQTNLQNVTVLSNTSPPKIGIGENIPSLSYLGGPNSVYGIGNTNIKRYTITNFNPNKSLFKDIAIQAVDNLTRIEDQNIANDQYLASSATGVSRIDSRLYKYADKSDPNFDPNNAISIRDNTTVQYTDIQPRLRQYYQLLDQIDKTVTGGNSSKSSLFNIVDADTLNAQNNINNTLSKDNVTTIRQVSSTEGTIKNNFPNNELVYKNGIIDANGNYEKVVIKKFSNWNAISREKRVGSGRQDSINLTPIFGGNMKNESKDSKGNTVIDKYGDKYWMGDKVVIGGKTHNIRDLVKFRISSVLTDTPDKVNTMVFRAYLTSLTDNVDAPWNSVNYAGRGNPFYIYNGFTRKVQIGFKVAALSQEEMQPMYSKLNYLMSTLMPDYNGVLMRGPLVRMTIGNYFDAQLGLLNSLSYTVPNDSPWEIALDEPEGGTKQLILPHVLDVTLGFTPIGAETQGANKIEAKVKDNTYIAQNNTGVDKDTIQYYDYFKNKFD